MRVLVATTANDGHFGPLLPFARACAAAGHEVAVAAPESYAVAVRRAGFEHRPFGDAPPELIGPIMATLPTLGFEEADDVVLREVFGRVDAQAGLPAVMEAVDEWRPDVVLRESAELSSLVAAERAGVPTVHVSIGMHEVVTRFAAAVAEPLVRARRHRRARGRPRDRRPGGRAGVQLGPRVARPCGGRGPARSGGLRPLPRARPGRGRRPPARLGRPGPATRLRDVRLGHRVARPLRRPLP